MYNINSLHHTITCFLLSLFDKSFYELLYPCLRYISCFLHQRFQGSTFFNSIWHNLNALFHFLRIVDCFLQFNMSLCTLTLFYVSYVTNEDKKRFLFFYFWFHSHHHHVFTFLLLVILLAIIMQDVCRAFKFLSNWSWYFPCAFSLYPSFFGKVFISELKIEHLLTQLLYFALHQCDFFVLKAGLDGNKLVLLWKTVRHFYLTSFRR